MPKSERLATVDAAWLNMDAPHNRMVITAVIELGDVVDPERFSKLIEQRLVVRYPRFRQRIDTGSLGEHRWVEDEQFDLRAHVHRIGLPRPRGGADGGEGAREALQELVSQLMSGPLDPARPLWQVHLVDIGADRTAMVARIHHAIADGISLARVLLSLADPLADDPRGQTDVEDDSEPVEGRLAGFLRASADAGGRLLDAGREVIADPQGAVSQTAEGIVAAARLGGGSASAVRRLLSMTDDPDSSLRGELGHLKVVAWSEGISLQRIKDVARALGGTVNDVLLTALADALGRYLRQRGDAIEEVRTFVPVNLRPLDRPVPRELGNRFGLVFLALPVGHQPARERFVSLKRRMDLLKRSPEPALTHALLSAVGLTPVQVERLVVEVFGAKASLITTNVPGPPRTLCLAGAPMDRVLFWVPQSGGVSLGVSLFSYAGTVVWGVSADRDRVPDPGRIVAFLGDALADLESAAGRS